MGMNGWMDGWMGMNGWMDGWMGMDGDEWMGGWMDGWMDGWTEMNGQISFLPFFL